MKISRWYNMPAKPGDLVVLPEISSRNMMWKAPFGWDAEIIIDECECEVLLPAEHIVESTAKVAA
jgi:hypothetical protein